MWWWGPFAACWCTSGATTARLTAMSAAAKSNVLMFLSAMCAVGAVWFGISAFGGQSVIFGVIAVALVAATVVAFRAYRAVLREMDAEGL